MTNKLFTIITAGIFLLCGGNVAWAVLIDNHDGTITQIRDDGSMLMWLQDANYANTSCYAETLYDNTQGGMYWADAATWAEDLVFAGYDDWRLPKTLPINGVAYDYTLSFDGSTDYGLNITSPNSEMSYMYYVELGNLSHTYPDGSPVDSADRGLLNTGPFVNLIPALSYWSETEYSPNTEIPDGAWCFLFESGTTDCTNKYNWYFAWPVRDITSVPIPGTMILFGFGVGGVCVRRITIQKKAHRQT